MKKELNKTLKQVKQILGDVPFWLSGGQVLGAIRDKGFLHNEHDIDLGIFEEDLDRTIKMLKKKFKRVETNNGNIDGVALRLIDGTDMVRVIKFKLNGIGVDIFVYILKNNRRYAITKDPHIGHAWHSFPRDIFENLETVKLYGTTYKIPESKTYLKCEYGNWKKKVKHWNCCIDPPCIAKKVYLGGVFDLFHVGHLNLLKNAREYGEILYASVLTDEAAEIYKRKTITPYNQRVKIIKEFADVVLPQENVDECRGGLIEEINPDVIVHGDDKLPHSYSWALLNHKKVIMLPYTKDVSTTQIINKIKSEG